MKLSVITLELARNPGQPAGDPDHKYVFRAPLGGDARIDRTHWTDAKALCTVKRFEGGHEAESGLLILNGRNNWVFSYAPGDDDDEALFRLGDHKFAVGEYVSITEHDGVQRTFKVASVGDWHPDPSAGA